MLVDDEAVCESLRAIVAKASGDPALQQDLMQECLFRLWKLENEGPGQTKSWYLQNCRFHVQHYLASGRSVDSFKRARAADNRITIDLWGDVLPREDYHTNGELIELVCANEMVATLSRHLKPVEKAILDGLAEDRTLREVAVQLDLSYPTALKHRRRIANLVLKLGLADRSRSALTALPAFDDAKLARPILPHQGAVLVC
ncbi:MAG: hypothetical protein L0Y58_15890 [Verrucomicrobia subdivision 3 bacterium]|nr:hypothetical protein [Limisphaerales bacterium]